MISNKNILKPQENKRTNREYRGGNKKRRRKVENKKTSEANKELITKKRTKEHRDRITRGESPMWDKIAFHV